MSDKKPIRAAHAALRQKWRKHRTKEVVLSSAEVWALAVAAAKLKNEEKKHDET